MQKLRERRLTDIPTDIPQVCSSMALCQSKTDIRTEQRPALNSREGSGSVKGLTTSLNNSDAVPTPKGARHLRVSVAVLNQRGKPLMPCSPHKARVLLASGKATVYKKLTILDRAKTLLIERTMRLLPDLKDGVSAAQR